MSKIHTRLYIPWNNRYTLWVVLVVPLMITAAAVVLYMTARAPYLLVWLAVVGGIPVALLQFALVRNLGILHLSQKVVYTFRKHEF
ncbi:MAG: hypothetical protein WCR46_24670, partial [Deltaproteobacteria bacterium]